MAVENLNMLRIENIMDISTELSLFLILYRALQD